VEIVKRPGQTLGLYIREGNGVDRYDGVFVSRIAIESAVFNSGCLSVGDEILAVNLVDVTHMSLDDVVILMSIPRRLVLTIRQRKGRILSQSQSMIRSESKLPPVVVMKKEFEDDRYDDGMDENARMMPQHSYRGVGSLPPGGAMHMSYPGGGYPGIGRGRSLQQQQQMQQQQQQQHLMGSSFPPSGERMFGTQPPPGAGRLGPPYGVSYAHQQQQPPFQSLPRTYQSPYANLPMSHLPDVAEYSRPPPLRQQPDDFR